MRERKYKTEKFILNLVHIFTDKSIKEKPLVWDFKKCRIATDKKSSWKTQPPTNIGMKFLVATLVWMPSLNEIKKIEYAQ